MDIIIGYLDFNKLRLQLNQWTLHSVQKLSLYQFNQMKFNQCVIKLFLFFSYLCRMDSLVLANLPLFSLCRACWHDPQCAIIPNCKTRGTLLECWVGFSFVYYSVVDSEGHFLLCVVDLDSDPPDLWQVRNFREEKQIPSHLQQFY